MSRYINPVPDISDVNGKPIVGAKLFFFETGSGTTLKTIYIDSALTIPQSNPALSDSSGRYPNIFLDGIYKVESQDNSGTPTGYDGVTLWTRDPVGDVGVTSEFQIWNNSQPYIVGSIVKGSDFEYYKSKIDPNTGNDPTISPAAWTLLNFGEVWNSTTDYPVGATTYASDGFEYLSTVTPNVGNDPRSTSQWINATRQGQSAIASGTPDAITAAYLPPFVAIKDGLELRVRASGANTITNPTFTPDGISTAEIKKSGNQLLVSSDIAGAGHELLLKYNLSLDVWELMNPATQSTGVAVQQITTTTNTILTTTTAMMGGVAAPTNTEGMEVLTLSITPKIIGSKINLYFNCNCAVNSTDVVIAALFKDTDVNAIASAWNANDAVTTVNALALNFEYTTTSLTAITFKIRAGATSATLFAVNGNSGGTALLGGTSQATLRATEVQT